MGSSATAVIEGFPLAPQQRRVWTLARGGWQCVCQCAVAVEGNLDVDRLEAALSAVSGRHECLRTVYAALPGMEMPVQVVGEGPPPVLRRLARRLDVVPGDKEDALADALLAEERGRLGDAGEGPLATFALLPVGERWLLSFTVSALSADERSLRNLVAEVAAEYAAGSSGGDEEEPVQYTQFSEWVNDLQSGEDSAEGREHWRAQHLAEMLDGELPFEPRNLEGTASAPRVVTVPLPQELAGPAGDADAAFFLSAWYVLLARLGGRWQLGLSTLFDGRSYEEMEDALGLYCRWPVLALRHAGDERFRDLAAAVRRSLSEAAEWQEYFAWEQVTAAQGKVPESLPSPWAFSWHEGLDPIFSDGLTFRFVRQHAVTERARLELAVSRGPDGVTAELRYDPSRYAAVDVQRLAERLGAVLDDARARPEATLGELEMLSADERRTLLEGSWSAVPFETETTLCELFARRVELEPGAPAVIFDGELWTFEELARRAHRLTRALRARGVVRGSRVVLCLERSPWQIAGVLGILEAGAAFVPLDPWQPEERLAEMARQAAPAAILTAERFRKAFEEDLALCLDRDQEDIAAGAPAAGTPAVPLEGTPARPGDLAYVIFTSGSTGRPKGVMVEHRSVAHLMAALEHTIYAGSGVRRVAVNAPLSFDASIKQVIQLLQGRTLCLIPEEIRPDAEALRDELMAREVDAFDVTPGQLRLLLDAGLGDGGPGLVLVGGEAVDPELWDALVASDAAFWNVYGPTECTVDVTAHLVTPGRPSLGRTLPNVRALVAGGDGRLAPLGVAGELLVGGPGVARGYLDQPRATAERFVPDPWSGAAGARLYRTGDRVRRGDGGELEFLGRLDHQVKVRGFRIELGEIEAALAAHAGIRQAVVLLRDDGDGESAAGDPRLVAYVVPKAGRSAGVAEIEGRPTYELPNRLAVVQQNRNETDYLYEEIFLKRCYAQHGISLPPGACVFDVGANIGMYTLFVHQECEAPRVYAFEPIAPIFETLRLNRDLHTPDVKLFPFGLAAADAEERFTYYPRYSMMSGHAGYARPESESEVVKRYLENLRDVPDESETSEALLAEADELLAGRFEGETVAVKLRRLSDVMREEGVEHVDLLKIDVQRAELDVLRGLDEADWPKVDQVVLEVHDAPGDETEGRVEEIRELLAGRGFEVVAEQDELLVGTDRYNVYAWRPEKRSQAPRPAASETSGAPPAGSPAAIEPVEVTDETLRAHLRTRLPDYMVPSAFVILPRLPLKRAGKVDREALPRPEEVAASVRRVEPPRTAFEEMIATIWLEVLSVDAVGRSDNFFELGGHSLLATRLMARLREHLRVDLPLRALFEAPTVAALGERVESAVARGQGLEIPPIARRADSGEGEVPLSFSQQRLWLLHRLEPANPAYNSPKALRLRGELDTGALRRALTEIVRRHEILRTSLPEVDGRPVQRVAPPAEVPLPVADLSGLGATAAESEGRRLARQEAARPFDLTAAGPLRVALARLGQDDHLLLFTLHHVASDARALDVLVREMAALYDAFRAGRPSPLAELPIQYADYAAWQRGWLRGEVLDSQVEAWRRRLAGAPELLELPTDRPRRAERGALGGSVYRRLPAPLVEALEAYGRERGATLFMVLLAALQALLGRLAGQDDVSVGSPIAGRRQVETEDLIGLFVNTLVLRTRLRDEHGEAPSFHELVEQVRDTVLEAFAYQDLPFDKLVEELQPRRDLSHTPLFQVTAQLQVLGAAPSDAVVGDTVAGASPAAKLPGLTLEPFGDAEPAARFDLSWSWASFDGGVAGVLGYSRDLFDRTTAERMLRHFEALLSTLVTVPAGPVDAADFLSRAGRHQLLSEWSDGEAPRPASMLVHRRFARRAARTPDAAAVVWENGTLSYGELDRRSARLARHLASRGAGPDVPVAVFLERSPELVVTLLGVLRSGAAYLALDPDYPAERLAFMLDDAAAPLLVSTREMAARLPGDDSRATVLWDDVFGSGERLDAPLPQDRAPQDRVPQDRLPQDRVAPSHLSYLIYTSGSTGRPKGAMVPHLLTANRVAWFQEKWPLDDGDRVLHKTPVSFDVSVWEIFWPLTTGAATVLARPGGHLDPDYLIDWIVAARVTTTQFVPSILRLFLESPASEHGHSLRRLVASGEALPRELTERYFERLDVEMHNIYGPSEAAPSATVWHCERPPAQPVAPIGRTIANVRAVVADRRLRPLPIGVAGELLLAGLDIGRGYLRRPALTAERYVPGGPALAGIGERLYRTGDLVRWLAVGEMEFLGRIDHQVKVRGIRLELGEVEAALESHPAVRQAVASVFEPSPGHPGDRRLAAWVVTAGEAAPSLDEVRAFLAARLPDVMVPASLTVLEKLPMTPSGKVDRKSLPEPSLARAATDAGDGPRGELEELLAAIWRELLPVAEVGRGDDFFELGGHSLLATRLVARLREGLGVEVPLRAVFEAPRFDALAARVEAALLDDGRLAAPPLRAASRVGGEAPLSFGQQRLWVLHRLDPADPSYNSPKSLRLDGPLDVAALSGALSEIVRRHEVLRTVYPTDADERPVQRVRPPMPHDGLPVADLGRLDASGRRAESRRLAREEALRPYDLTRQVPLRVALLRLADERHQVLFTLHHIASDAWSLDVLIRELATLYEACRRRRPSPLGSLPVQYADFAQWQRGWLQGEVLDAQVDYWRRRLAGAPSLLELPTDRPRPALRRHRGAPASLRLPPELSETLLELARQWGATPFMLLLGATQTLLARISSQDDVSVGVPIAGRRHLETEPLIGFFVNTLVMRQVLSPEATLESLTAEVRDALLSAFAHQDLPFEKLVEELQPERSLSYTPLFQVVVQRVDADPLGTALAESAAGDGGLRLTPVPEEAVGARFDLTWSWRQQAGGLEVHLVYDRDLFDATTALRCLRQTRRLLESAVAEPDRPLSELSLLSPAEHHQLSFEAAAPMEPYGGERAVHQFFEEHARRIPDAVAVVCEERALSYGELDGRANQLAHHLLGLGVTPGQPVALALERDLEMVLAVLGILKAGACYVPLDPAHPPERLRTVLDDAFAGVAAPLAVTGGEPAAKLAEVADGLESLRLVRLDAGREVLTGESRERPATGASPRDLAYVIYTSGSTGHPKGVMVEHPQVVRLLTGTDAWYGFDERDVWSLFHSIAFDVSVWELWGSLARGGRLAVVPYWVSRSPGEFYELLSEKRVTFLSQTPSAFRQLVAEEEERARRGPEYLRRLALREVVFGGEALEFNSLVPWFDRHGDRRPRLVNMYGITETTVHSTYRPLSSGDIEGGGRSAVGGPIPDLEILLFDRRGRAVPSGVSGEIHVGGAGLSRGYLARPALTAERFVPHPYARRPGSRLYRSGDLARRTGLGDFEYLGRIDHQVKVRGFRIELGEIEAVLGSHPAVREVVVLTRDKRAGQKQLVAWVCGPDLPPAKELRAFAKTKLPLYMVPAIFVPLDSLPLTANGKVDRRALLAMPLAARPDAADYAAPRDEVEETLAAIWQEVLAAQLAAGPGEARRVGIHDNFFDLGGDSILAIQIVGKARRANVDVTPRQVFEHQTIAELAAVAGTVERVVAEQGPVTGPAPLTPIQHGFLEGAERDPHHFNQAVLFELRADLAPGVPPAAVARVVAHHDALRLRFTRTENGWRQRFAGLGGPSCHADVDLSALGDEHRAAALERAADQVQGGFDLSAGPLLRSVRFARRPRRPDLLLIAAHHLVVDGVSWRILLEDLHDLIADLAAGRDAVLPAKTTSFQTWARRLEGHARSPEVAAELDGWLAPARTGVAPLPVDHAGGANTWASAERFTASLGAEDTEAVLREVPEAYSARVDEVLLTALAETLARFTGSADVLVGMEGHGREEIFDDVDLSRTVGWFTTLYPVVLRLPGAPDEVESEARAGDDLQAVKEQVRKVPARGLGYGLLRYLGAGSEAAARLAETPPVELVFNYHGQVDAALPASEIFAPSGEPAGRRQSPRATRRHLLEVTARIAGGELRVVWTYSRNIHERATIERLAGEFLDRLRTLAEHSRSVEETRHTPSDFDDVDLTQDELDKALAEIDL